MQNISLKNMYLGQGCGYPPAVNCSSWIRQFGVEESTFPCYYARYGPIFYNLSKKEEEYFLRFLAAYMQLM